MLKKILFTFILLNTLCSCHKNKATIHEMTNLYPWCIVPFDLKERTPEARIQMLQKLGFKEYAYDGKKEHLHEMAREWAMAKEKGIRIRAIWMWIDDRWDTTEQLNETNEIILNTLKAEGLETQVWVGFHANFFSGLEDDRAVEKGKKMIAYLSKRAAAINCKIGLYNHGDWLGEPENQIKIIKSLPELDLGIVYNFHHAYNQVDRFPVLVDLMLPYLWSVNLSGVKKGDASIYEIGQGDHEKEMLELLIKKGYRKGFGILGHRSHLDVAKVLKGNMKGFSSLQILDK